LRWENSNSKHCNVDWRPVHLAKQKKISTNKKIHNESMIPVPHRRQSQTLNAELGASGLGPMPHGTNKPLFQTLQDQALVRIGDK